MVLTEVKYYIRPILLVIGYILLCVGGAFFIYLIWVANPPGSTEYPFGHVVAWAIGLTVLVIGFIGLLLIFKLLDYFPSNTEDQERVSS
jgi:cytochrome c oxidase assembly factor CtaG